MEEAAVALGDSDTRLNDDDGNEGYGRLQLSKLCAVWDFRYHGKPSAK